MAKDQASYLEHLERWLDYEDDLDSPQLAEGVLLSKPKTEVPRKRVGSFLDNKRRKQAKEHCNQCTGGCKDKCATDRGDMARVAAGVPLPSCARDEEGEEYAGNAADTGLVDAVKQNVKTVLGFRGAH